MRACLTPLSEKVLEKSGRTPLAFGMTKSYVPHSKATAPVLSFGQSWP